MVPELQKPQIIEIHVRMDCNGCVQKIKKVLCGISGIYDLYIDFPQQKIIIVGWADPEKIVKTINKKTRKIATIGNIEPIESSPSQQAEPSSSEPTEQEHENAKAHEQAEAETQPHFTEEATPPPAENPKKDTPPQHEKSPHDQTTQLATQAENNAFQQPPRISTPRARDVEEIHLIHHHSRTRDVGEIHPVIQHHHSPPNYGIGNRYGYVSDHGYGHSYVGHWDRYHNSSPAFHQQEPHQPIYVTHSYNAYRPSPYVTEYEYVMSPPRSQTHYNNNRMEYYSENYYYHNGSNTNGNGNGNITSMFSDENPNACRIV